jgi:hypothetical protein
VNRRITNRVQLCVVIDKEGRQLRVVIPVVRSCDEDATLKSDGVTVERAVGRSLSYAVDDIARIVNAKVEELGGLGLGLPGASAALAVLVRVAILEVILVGRVVVRGTLCWVPRLRLGLGLLSGVRLVVMLDMVGSFRRLRVIIVVMRRDVLYRVVARNHGRGASQAKETQCQEVSLHLVMSGWE